MPASRRGMRPCSWNQPPIKNPDKWPLEDDALIIKLQESGIRWEDVSPEDKLSRVYESLKAEMWAKIAAEMAIAMHWQLGETDLARRAIGVLFSLASVNIDDNSNHQNPPSPSHAYSQYQGSFPLHLRATSPQAIYSRPSPVAGDSSDIVSHYEESRPPLPQSIRSDPHEVYYMPGYGLALIQGQPPPREGLTCQDVFTSGNRPFTAPGFWLLIANGQALPEIFQQTARLSHIPERTSFSQSSPGYLSLRTLGLQGHMPPASEPAEHQSGPVEKEITRPCK
ncbi:hypothetical protein B0T10DRAFT_552368 [Thelonectria olida]|uniref:Uncharacterized protein n=1 Tax=Thelonectria olida TaxID=1576542 RepID=A0A9P8VQR5_9HYPO|nr:hypothetical protein B0T10DRAFT_553581 [Thelonectria olida]KAH6876696.1 hypothetical protein B0T10DRAFT_552368 [Thelonectria olida]